MAKAKKRKPKASRCETRLRGLLRRGSSVRPATIEKFMADCVRSSSLRGTGSVIGPQKKRPTKKKKRNLAGARSAPLSAGKQHTADQTGRSHCVYSPDNSLVRCFSKAKTAEQVARGFGSGFHTKKRRG